MPTPDAEICVSIAETYVKDAYQQILASDGVDSEYDQAIEALVVEERYEEDMRLCRNVGAIGVALALFGFGAITEEAATIGELALTVGTMSAATAGLMALYDRFRFYKNRYRR